MTIEVSVERATHEKPPTSFKVENDRLVRLDI